MTPTQPADVSRRSFLKGTGLSAAATALANSPVQALAQEKAPATASPPALGPQAVPLALTVNGQKLTTNVEPRVTLLDALRNYLDHTSPKRVCDRGTCGACTVLVEGKPIYSCMCLALEARGKTIETAENFMVPDGKLDPVPAAFVKYDASQCGFCTPGFVVAMAAATKGAAKPTAEQIETGLCGNICRCGTYQQMRDALRSLAAPVSQ